MTQPLLKSLGVIKSETAVCPGDRAPDVPLLSMRLPSISARQTLFSIFSISHHSVFVFTKTYEEHSAVALPGVINRFHEKTAQYSCSSISKLMWFTTKFTLTRRLLGQYMYPNPKLSTQSLNSRKFCKFFLGAAKGDKLQSITQFLFFFLLYGKKYWRLVGESALLPNCCQELNQTLIKQIQTIQFI